MSVASDLQGPNFRVDRRDSLAILTLTRPERRNALSLQMMRDLTACLLEIGRDTSVAAVVLASTGKVFCSGHDLAEMADGTPDLYQAIFHACTELMTTIQSIPQPVIAKVQGLATAAGCQLVATCDLAIASTDASFATPGVRIGLFCSTPMVALSRAIGRKRALEMLLTGRVVPAEEAASWGLVNRVVPVDQLEPAAESLARQIVEASTYTVSVGKRAFYEQIDLPQPEAYRRTSAVMTENAAAPDAQEGISAFLAKRPPCWAGR